MKMFSKALLLVWLGATAGLTGCGKKTVEPAAPTTGSFAIEMEQLVDLDPLALNSLVYTKADGQTYTVSKFKFLVSNLKMSRADGTTYAIPDGYYLIDAANSASSHIVIDNVPLGDYTGLSFVVGVDAAHNNGTFQSGALAHSSELYSEATQQYTFMKMAGSFLKTGASAQALAFEIGGPNAVRQISPAFSGNTFSVTVGHIPLVHFGVNLQGLFASATPANVVNFTTTYAVSSDSPWAPIMADNYAANMFVLEHIHPN